MALHGCLRCMKYVVFTFNFIVWLAGMGVLGLAIWLRMDPKVNHYMRVSFEQTEITTYYIICYVLMAVGGVMTFVGFLGCCGAFQESKCMLGAFFSFLLLILGAEAAGAAWAYHHRGEIEKSVTTTFKDMVQSYYRTSKDPLIDEAIDFVQASLQCCGGEHPTDWHASAWVQQDILSQLRVPDSCCKVRSKSSKRPTPGVCGQTGAWTDGYHKAVWEQGCGEALKQHFKQNLFLMIAAGFAIAVIQLVGMIFSLALCCAMRRSRGGGYKS